LLKIDHIDTVREDIHFTFYCCSWTVEQIDTPTPQTTINLRHSRRSLNTNHPPSWRP
jgi:hypothetical protein